ncbi:MAG: DUF5719 family protein [Actinomycetota bacterium]|nr:DUF5719 family protein [Actinomycetota bacterium]
MRRTLLLLLAGFAAAFGFIQVAPPIEPGPNFGTTDIVVQDGAVSSPSVWYCPGIESGDVVDTDVLVVTHRDVDVILTLLDPVANVAPTVDSFTIVGPGAASVDVGKIMRRGESPALIEISDGPAAAASIAWAESLLAGDRCVVSVPKVWYLTGGSTRVGTFTELRLFNPFADVAEVTVTAYSEFGVDLVPELDGLEVAGRSWATIEMESRLEFRDELAFTVTSSRGLVIPIIVRTDDRGEAIWPGSAPSSTWDFPIVTLGGLEPFIAVLSASGADIVVSLDIVTETGVVLNARQITLDSSAPALIPLADLAAPPFGVRLRATAPVAASVIAVVPVEDIDIVDVFGDDLGDDTTTTEASTTFIRGMAGTVGIATPSSAWIVPLTTLPNNETTLWVMNNGADPVSVEAFALGEVDFLGVESFIVAPGTIVGVKVEVGIGIYGYHVIADGLVSVAWEMSGERGAVLVAGVPASE